MKKSKVAFLLTNEIFFRHYISTGALSYVAKNHDLTIFVDEATWKSVEDNLEGYDTTVFRYSEKLNRIARTLNELTLFAHRNFSRDFSFRIQRKYNTSPHLRDGRLNKNPLKLRVKSWLKRNLFIFLSQERLMKTIENYAANLFRKHSPVRKLAYDGDFDLILCPSNAGGTADTDVCAMGNESQKPKTVLLIDNWDNLTSKYVMPFKPHQIAVWGEQTKQDAITVQKIHPSNIEILGTPRFYDYFQKKNRQANGSFKNHHLPNKYALFVGSQTFWDEAPALEKLDRLFKRNFEDLTLIYRPHPWRETFGQTFVNPEGIRIDPSLNRTTTTNSNFPLPDLTTYRDVIEGAELLIGGCTSVIVEAGILKKRYLLLAHDDGNPIQSPFDYYRRAEHQNLTFGFDHVEICFSLDDLGEAIRSLLRKNISSKDRLLEKVISDRTGNYPKNLNRLVERLVGDGSKQ